MSHCQDVSVYLVEWVKVQHVGHRVMKSIHFVRSGLGIRKKPLVGFQEIKSHDNVREEKGGRKL